MRRWLIALLLALAGCASRVVKAPPPGMPIDDGGELMHCEEELARVLMCRPFPKSGVATSSKGESVG